MTVTADPQEGSAETRSRSNNMSLTYSDFLYTRNEYEEDNVGEVRRSLPSDLKPIRETPVALIQNAEASDQDFLIIAEFSELEGPIPLCTIPSGSSEKSDIKLNDFVVHLMSTDYQVNTVGQFRICQDTQVMRKNVFPGVHVLMQYFTMYDIKARGFVRPFCFGYVSKDHVKLDKYLAYLTSEFKTVTCAMEQCNRDWFCEELKFYLSKLQNAKDSYIQEHSNNSCIMADDNQSDEFVDSDSISLAQLAHQYSEIQNILTIVQNFQNNYQHWNESINDISLCLERQEDNALSMFLKRNGILCDSANTTPVPHGSLLESLPLLHPLRAKGEQLRPLTILGQLGSVYLVGRLIHIYSNLCQDIIYADIADLTTTFVHHFNNSNIHPSIATAQINRDANNSPAKSSGFSSSVDFLSSSSAVDSSFSDDSRISSEQSVVDELSDKRFNNVALWLNLKDKELFQTIEKLHVFCPLAPDNKSGSYHTVSDEDSDINFQSQLDTGTEQECVESMADDNSTRALCEQPTVNNPELQTEKQQTEPAQTGEAEGRSGQEKCLELDTTNPKMNSLTSFSSDEEMSLGFSPSSGTSEEIILRESWLNYASKKLVRGVPGYGIANFFRRYHEAAHHVLYSILLGRPIIICGEEKLGRKVGRIITSLIPLVPAVRDSIATHSNSSNIWKLLRWHRGILVQSHIESYRLIGLCIPEKLEVHDLIPPRLVTLVTILSVDKKRILGGPAYSGDLLQNFEKKYQKHFYNSDTSILSYIGALYADIECKVFMYKALAAKYKSIHLLFKELNVRASDIEIVKYLGGLISDPSKAVNIL